MVGEAKLHLKSNPITTRDTWRAETKPHVHQDPGTPHETNSGLPLNVWVSPAETPWRRKQQPTPVFTPGKSHGPRSLVGYNPVRHDWATSGCRGTDQQWPVAGTGALAAADLGGTVCEPHYRATEQTTHKLESNYTKEVLWYNSPKNFHRKVVKVLGPTTDFPTWGSKQRTEKVKLLSHVWLFATQWTVAHQAPQSMGFSRQE